MLPLAFIPCMPSERFRERIWFRRSDRIGIKRTLADQESS
jgi:hypothetical protein